MERKMNQQQSWKKLTETGRFPWENNIQFLFLIYYGGSIIGSRFALRIKDIKPD